MQTVYDSPIPPPDNTLVAGGRDIAAAVSDIGDRILSVCAESEPHFLTLGNVLSTEYTKISDFTQKTIDAITSAGASNDTTVFNHVESVAKDALSQIRDNQDVVISRCGHINTIMDLFQELADKRSRIETLIKHLNAIGFNMTIESARSENASKEFSIIARDIRQLSETIRSVIQSLRDTADEAGGRLASAFSTINTGLQTLQNLMTEARSSVVDSIQKTGQIIAYSIAAVEQAGERSREISRQVETLVIGMQFHDSMRQRLEHIATALNDAATTLTAPEDPDTSPEGLAHLLATLQSEQLRHIITEISDVHEKNLTAFRGMIEETRALSNNLTGAISGGNASGTLMPQDDPFTVLTVTLMNIQSLQDQAKELTTHVNEAFSSASDTASLLSGHADQIHEISREADTRSLNALIAAERLGLEGKTMAVLAQEMKTLSNQSDQFVSDIEETITEISETVNYLSGSGTEASLSCNADTLEQQSLTSRQALDDMITDIFNTYESMKSESATLAGFATAICDDLAAAGSYLEFFNPMETQLSTCLEQLTGIIEMLSPWALDASDAKVLELSSRYTMKSERDIHERTLSGDGSTPDDIESDTDDELDDSIELF